MEKFRISILLVLLLFIALSCKQEKKRSWVFDYESDLTFAQEQQFDSLFISHEAKTTNEFALVTTPDYQGDSSLFWFSQRFFNKHGIGKKDINNGLLIVFSKNLSEVRIHTGRGTEKVIQDTSALRVIDTLMIPRFKQGQFFEGLFLGCKALTDYLERPENKIK